MEIRSWVLAIRNERNFQEFQTYYRSNPKEIEDLIQLINQEEAYPIAEYASWILVHLAKAHPEGIQPFYDCLVDELHLNTNQTVRRNIIAVLDQLQLTSYRESEFIDLLVSFIEDFQNKVAIQVYAMQVLTSFVLKYADLKVEIQELIELHSENKSPAYRAAMRKFFKKTKHI